MSNKRSNNAGHADARKKRSKTSKDRSKSYDKFAIRPNMKGVMVTCTRGKEAAAVKEVVDLFEQYAAELYPEAFADKDDDNDDDEDDIEAAIQKELAQMKKGKQRKFASISTNMDCVLFIEARDPVIEPVPLVHHILSDLQKTKRKRTRFVSRLLPVQNTCNANLPAIELASKPILAPKFHTENEQEQAPSRKFAVQARIRNCDKMDRLSVIQTLASVVGPGHSVDLNHPDITIIAEICQDICMLSAVEDFNEFKKYNIESIIAETSDPKESQEKQQKKDD